MPLFRPTPLPPASPIRLAFEDETRDGRRRVLILLLGVPASGMEAMLRLADRSLRADRDEPIFVVSDLDFGIFRTRGLLFELLPDAGTLRPDDPDRYADHVRRRLDLIRLKWCPAVELDLGSPFERFLADNAARIQRATA